MKLIFMGTPAFTLPVLNALSEKHKKKYQLAKQYSKKQNQAQLDV